jgi:hypothetical protein
MATARPLHLLIRGDARHLPLPDGSVHCCACSPPFFGLRDYQTAEWIGGDPDCDHRESKPSRVLASIASSSLKGGKGNIHRSHEFKGDCLRCGARRVDRQIGLEPSPDEFVEAMRVVAAEIWRVLRDDGSWYLNLGDSFAGSWGNQGRKKGRGSQRPINGPMIQNLDPYPVKTSNTGKIPEGSGLKAKDLCMVPERVAIALQSDGWFLRAKPPWIKPNPMPDSTDDRPNVAHESIFLLTKSPRYYFDMEAVRIPSAASTLTRDQYSRITQSGNKSHVPGSTDHSGIHKTYAVSHNHETSSDPGGRHLRTNDFFTASLDALIEHHEDYLAHLREIRDKGGLLLSEDGDPLAFWQATKSFSGAHFATWPPRLVEPMIKASTSEKGCCRACGSQWIRVVEKESFEPIDYEGKNLETDPQFSQRRMLANMRARREAGYPHDNPFVPPKTLGWTPGCSCDAGNPVPCVVLDPFCGSGATVLTAGALGRHGIGLDLNADYLAIASRRIERPHARVARPARAGAPTPLFDGIEDQP